MKDGGSVYSYGIGKAGQLGFGDSEKNVTSLKKLSFFTGIVIVSVHCGFAQSAAISSLLFTKRNSFQKKSPFNFSHNIKCILKLKNQFFFNSHK